MNPQNKNSKLEMDTRTKFTIGVILAAFLFGGFSYFIKGNISSSRSSNEKKVESVELLVATTSSYQDLKTNTTPSSGTGSLSNVWKMTGSRKCEISILASSSKVNEANGVVYIYQNKIRADFYIKIPNIAKVLTSSLIQKDGEIYSWTDVIPQGFISKMDANTDLSRIATGNSATNDDVKYNCSSWSPDNSMFDLPKNITFMDTPPR